MIALPRLAAPLLVVVLAAGACATPEDPARAELRARLKQDAVLSADELNRTLDAVVEAIQGRAVQTSQDGVVRELDAAQRDVVLGMLTQRTGVYDEGLRTIGGTTVRVFNAPAISQHAEYSAARKLLVNVETFVPIRFEFRYEFQGIGDYDLDLVVAPR